MAPCSKCEHIFLRYSHFMSFMEMCFCEL
jgi:hypothetical protein